MPRLAQATENATPSRMRRLNALAHTPEARARLCATKRGQPLRLSPQAQARLRAAIRRPKSAAWRKRASELVRQRIARHGPINPRQKLWRKAEDRLLGMQSDEALARQLGRTAGAVRSRRSALAIPLRHAQFKPWTKAEERLLGTQTDARIAALLGRHERGVQVRRQSLGITDNPSIERSASSLPRSARDRLQPCRTRPGQLLDVFSM